MTGFIAEYRPLLAAAAGIAALLALIDPTYAYTPYVPEGEEHVKTPDWLNDVRYYHNRGATTFEGENSQYGDFSSLDDVMTENPEVVDGFIDIYADWIDRYGIHRSFGEQLQARFDKRVTRARAAWTGALRGVWC